jgi:hypothetical protein
MHYAAIKPTPDCRVALELGRVLASEEQWSEEGQARADYFVTAILDATILPAFMS